MNALEAALLEITVHLEDHRVPYMVIGGFANLHWGKPRLTQDVDLKIDVAEPDWGTLSERVGRAFRILVPDPTRFLIETRVLPIESAAGVRIDLIVAELPYEREAIRRAIDVPVAGRVVRLCTAEDLVLHKILSDRTRDRDDVEGILRTQGDRIDRTYLDPRVREIAEGLERPEILDFYEACLARTRLFPGS